MEFQVCSKGHTVTIQPWTSFFTVIAKHTPCIRCDIERRWDNGSDSRPVGKPDGAK